jgi:ectoine hydroxylase-related dioxygenase (phytanoyl-CoA dioxygenase family)
MTPPPPEAATPSRAGSDRRTRYRHDGFVIEPELLSSDEVAALRHELVRIVRGELGPVDGLEAPGPAEPDGDVIRRYACIHFPHKLSAVMRDAVTHPAIVDVLRDLIGPDVKAMQSMLFTKGEGKPGQAWHQDEYFIPTRDRSLTAAWIALDDATVDNGCLWVVPGSQRDGVIYPAREHDDERFDASVEAYGFPHDDSDAIAVELTAGSVLFFDGYLLHRSLPNTGRAGMRRALVNHYMSAQSLLPWGAPPAEMHAGRWDYRDVILVAGRDPYAFKGTVDASRPHVRPSFVRSADRELPR